MLCERESRLLISSWNCLFTLGYFTVDVMWLHGSCYGFPRVPMSTSNWAANAPLHIFANGLFVFSCIHWTLRFLIKWREHIYSLKANSSSSCEGIPRILWNPENCHLNCTNRESFKTYTHWSTVNQTQMYDKLPSLYSPIEYIYIYIYIHTHTHTHIYIYI